MDVALDLWVEPDINSPLDIGDVPWPLHPVRPIKGHGPEPIHRAVDPDRVLVVDLRLSDLVGGQIETDDPTVLVSIVNRPEAGIMHLLEYRAFRSEKG